MEIEPERTPSHYAGITCVEDLGKGVKLMRNTNTAGEVFFHVINEPPVEEITSPDDIEVEHAFSVASDENEEEVRTHALEKAWGVYYTEG